MNKLLMPITLIITAVVLFSFIKTKDSEIANSFASVLSKVNIPEPAKGIVKLKLPSPSPQIKRVQRIPKPKSRVLLVIYNPKIESNGGKKLTEIKNWNNPKTLTQSFIESVSKASNGNLNYYVAQTIEIDAIPVKASGFSYTDDSYLNCLNNTSTCHSLDLADYQKIISDTGACDKKNKGEIDELWMWGGPYFGYWESNLAGPNAYWYNSPRTLGTSCTSLLPIMGFNYERGEAEMFEDLGHRLESTMTKVYGSWAPNQNNAWNKFSLLDYDSPGNGGCGNAHLAVNALSNQGYDRTNTRSVTSSCDDFLNYPNLKGTKTTISCSAWKCDTLEYFKWWFLHLPQGDGQTDGKLNNWWKYIADPALAL